MAGSTCRSAIEYTIRDAAPADHARVLELNRAWQHFTSELDEAGLEHIVEEATLFRVAESASGIGAFLLAFGPAVAYESVNYRWFDARMDDFLYIDRVVVDRICQRGGLGATLYADAATCAREAGLRQLVCEVDIEPVNEVSLAFHARHGFIEVGTQILPGTAKRVSLQALAL